MSMLPSLAGLSIHGLKTAAVGVKRLQPPDYTAPGMNPYVAPDENTCSLCLEALSGPAHDQQDEFEWQSKLELEKLRLCGHQFHRHCLAAYVNITPNATCPFCKGEIQSDEAAEMKAYLLPPITEVTYHLPNGVTRVSQTDGNRILGMVRMVFPNGNTQEFTGARDHERLFRLTKANGDVYDYRGERGEEYFVKVTSPDGTIIEFEGTAGKEHHVKMVIPNGDTWYYLGEKNFERVVEIVQADGTIIGYTGPRGYEHIIRSRFSNGVIQEYEGIKNQEYVVRRISTSGAVAEFEGPRGREYKVRKRFPTGGIQEYEGTEPGKERLVRHKRNDGSVNEYNGEQGQEYIVQMKRQDGTIEYFDGPRGQERKVKELRPQGSVVYYEGPPGQEVATFVEAPGLGLKRQLSKGEAPPNAKR